MPAFFPNFVYGNDTVNVKSFGAVADGNSHTLGDEFASLGQAQTEFAFATDLAQQIDWAACKAASNVAFGADTVENGSNFKANKPLYIPSGSYYFGGDTWTIRNLGSGRILGAGNRVTQLRGNACVLSFDGLWYTTMGHFSVECLTDDASEALAIDGNVPGHPYATRGVQGNTLIDMNIGTAGGDYAFSLTRLGNGDGAPGAQGSENLFIKLHLNGASEACYNQRGFNALANQFIGGNFQSYTKHGAYILNGDCAFYKTGFQADSVWQQYLNDGWDIHVGDSGAGSCVTVDGCRTESMRFLRNAGGIITKIGGCTGNLGGSIGWSSWVADTVYAVDQAVVKELSDGLKHVFAVTAVAGDTKSGMSEPTWPLDFTPIVDDQVTWEEVDYKFMEIVNATGSVDRKSCSTNGTGVMDVPPATRVLWTDEDVTLTNDIDMVVVDATAGNRSVTLPSTFRFDWMRGKEILVKKSDTSANTVSIVGGNETGVGLVIAGGSRGYYRLLYSDGTGQVRSWLVVGSG